MPHPAREPIYEAIASIRLIDPHTHINPHTPGSSSLADLLGYHYYTELAHSAGMPKQEIEQEGLQPRELVRRLVAHLGPIENTAQYSWLIEICRTFFGFEGDRLDESNWESVYDSAENQMRLAEWPQMVLDQSNVEAVFLTNDFDDPLAGFDTQTYIPCLRTDDLVFHLAKYQTRQRLEACTGIELTGSLGSLRDSLKQRFEHFVAAGARACAISLPPSFEPIPISDGRAATALDEILSKGALADDSHQLALSRRVFWTLAELCDEFELPFDLMIGVNRGVYAGGVFQGQDLYDSRVSLIQYRELFNAFPSVKFPVSVLASVTNQELVSYAWIFPNVLTNGHWWYSNTPSFISRDAAARLEAVPRTKQIAYYSDAYKLEFVWPKFDMYRRILAGILAEHFVGDQGWSEERAIALGRQVLRDNVDDVFPPPPKRDRGTSADSDRADSDRAGTPADRQDRPVVSLGSAAGASASLAASGFGTVEVKDLGGAPADEDRSATGPNDEVGDEDVGDEDVTEYSTIVDSEVARPPESMSGDRQEHGFETVIEELKDSGSSDQTDDRVEGFRDDSQWVDRGTVVDLETVREELDEGKSPQPPFDPTNLETIEEQVDQDAISLDPVPNADEIQSVDVDDVELIDLDTLATADAEAIEPHLEAEPLDVGDLLGDEDDESATSQVRMLRGEESFVPDEESLKLRADPLTGELTFQVPSSESETESETETGEVETWVADTGNVAADDVAADAESEAESGSEPSDQAEPDPASDDDSKRG